MVLETIVNRLSQRTINSNEKRESRTAKCLKTNEFQLDDLKNVVKSAFFDATRKKLVENHRYGTNWWCPSIFNIEKDIDHNT